MNSLQKLLFSVLLLVASCSALAMERKFELTAEQTETFISIPPELYNCWVTVKNMLQDSKDIPENERTESIPLYNMTLEQYTIIKRYMDPILEQDSALHEPGKEQETAQQDLQKRLQQDLLNKILSIDELIGFINANDFNDCSFMLNAGIYALAAHIIQVNPNLQVCVNDPQALTQPYPFLQQLTDTLLSLFATALGELSESFDWLYTQQKPQLQRTLTEIACFSCMAFSHDDTALAVALEDASTWDAEQDVTFVKVWDTQIGNCTYTFETKSKPLADIPWGQWTSESCRVYGDMDKISAIAWSPNNQFLAYFNDSGVLSVWNMRTQKCINLKNENGRDTFNDNFFTSLVWSADSDYLITTSLDCTIKVWDFRDLDAIHYIHLIREEVELYDAFLAGNENGFFMTISTLNAPKELLATLNLERGTIKLIDTSDMTALKIITEIDPRKHTQEHIEEIHWSPDGTMLAAATKDSIIIIRDINLMGQEYTSMRCTASEIFMNVPLTTSSEIKTLSWAPDSKHMVVCTKDGSVAIVNVIKRSCVHTVAQTHSDDAQWSPQGAHLAIYQDSLYTDDPKITLWSLKSQWKAAFLRDISVEKACLIMAAYWAHQQSTQLQIPWGSFLRDAYEGLPQEIQALLDPYLVHGQDEPPAKRAKIESPTHP